MITRLLLLLLEYSSIFDSGQLSETMQNFSFSPLVDSWNELVLDNFTIFLPVLSILDRASLKVTTASVNENDEEEDWVEVRDGRGKTHAQSPGKRLEPVCSVVLMRVSEGHSM